MFAMNDEKLLILVMICCYLAFAVFYVAVYLLTSREYYKIVSRDEKNRNSKLSLLKIKKKPVSCRSYS